MCPERDAPTNIDKTDSAAVDYQHVAASSNHNIANPTSLKQPSTLPIKTIMFDMDGTLLDLAFDNYFWRDVVLQHWATQHHCSLATAVAQLTPQLKAHEGTLNWYSLDFWSSELNFDVAELKYQHRDKISLRPHAISTLTQLQAQPIDLWLVTNADPTALQIKLEQTGIAGFFKQIISSNTLGYAKEQAEFWHRLQAQYPFDPTSTLFVDDNPQVLAAAKQYGIAHLLDIHQPDSTQAAKTTSEHLMLVHLHELIDWLRQVAHSANN